MLDEIASPSEITEVINDNLQDVFENHGIGVQPTLQGVEEIEARDFGNSNSPVGGRENAPTSDGNAEVDGVVGVERKTLSQADLLDEILARNGFDMSDDEAQDLLDDVLQRNGIEPSTSTRNGGGRSKSSGGFSEAQVLVNAILDRNGITRPSPRLKGSKGDGRSKSSGAFSEAQDYLNAILERNGITLPPSQRTSSKGSKGSKSIKGTKKSKGSKSSKQTPFPTPGPPISASPTESPTPAPTESPTPAPTEAPTPAPTEAPTESPTEAPTESPTASPTASPTQPPTESPTLVPTGAPTTTASATTPGLLVLNEFCSVYESASGDPTQRDFDEGAGLTCAYLEKFMTDTFALGAPFILLKGIDCAVVSTSSRPVQICYEIATAFAPDSQVLPVEGDMDSLICIALSTSTPDVEGLIDALNLLSVRNPFSSTTALTCDI